MPNQSIDLVQLFKYSYSQYKKYLSFVIGIMTTYYVLAIIPQVYFLTYAPEDPTTESQILSGILTILQLYLSLGFIKIMLWLIDNKYVEVSDLFNNFRPFLSYFVASFIYMIGITIGIFLLVLPAIFIAIRFLFYPYFILIDNDTAITALHKSYNITQNLTLELFLFGTTVVTLNIIGVLFFGIGIIFTYPLTTMATAVIYKSLADNSKKIPSESYLPS